MSASRCLDCGLEYDGRDLMDYGLCPACQRIDDQLYANDPTPVFDGEYQPPKWSKAAMRERLGVLGDVDE